MIDTGDRSLAGAKLGLPMKFLLIACLSVALLGLSISGEADRREEPAQPTIDFNEIQTGVMAFADSWLALVGQGFTELVANTEEPRRRNLLRQIRYTSIVSAVDIAAGPYPGLAMVDMMVMAALSRATWDRHWVPQLGDAAAQLSNSYAQLERTIWALGGKYLSAAQLGELRRLADHWLTENPDAKAASFVRFNDLGALGLSPELRTEQRSGGLLSTVESAVETAESIEAMTERALFLAVRMPAIASERMELGVAQVVASDEVSQLLGDVSGFRRVAEEYSKILEDLPDDVEHVISSGLNQISAERTAAVEQIMKEISTEREAAIVQLMSAISTERQAALEQTIAGISVERAEMMGLVLHLVAWADLQAKTTFSRIFVLSACLILLYFLLRLVYRYMSNRDDFNFGRAVGTVVLLCITALPIIAIGTLYVEFSRPDMDRIRTMEDQLRALQAESAADTADIGDADQTPQE